MLNYLRSLYPVVLATSKTHPEAAHQQLLKTLHWFDQSRDRPWGQWGCKQLNQAFRVIDQRLSQQLWGLHFDNPLGLAAGFDKDGVAAGIYPDLGFGLVELGAVTLQPQPGNPKPRLFRLPDDQAALNRLGANNLGAVTMANTLHQTWQRLPRQIPVGINLCKSKVTPLDAAPEDYLGSFQYLKAEADYFVVNVSSPNTPGLRSLQSSEQLDAILGTLQQANQGEKPLLVKISPDLDQSVIATIIELAKTYQLAGIIATNTTTRRDGLKTQTLAATGNPITEEAGGISGLPIRERSTEIIRFIYRTSGGELPIIGVGGIFSAVDAWDKITAGASLLQMYTGWIYQGPWVVPQILKGLLTQLEAEGLSHLQQAIGIQAKVDDSL